MWKLRSQCEWNHTRLYKLEEMQGTIIRRRMPTKLIRPAMTLSYGTETLATTKRQENGIKVNEMRMLRLYVRSDKQRQDRERTLMRDNESCLGFQEEHCDNVELVRACDEER